MGLETTVSQEHDTKSPPLVSVIVPNYNHRAFLAERLASIKSQGIRDMEVILLDDASSDGSTALMEQAAGSFTCPVQLVLNEHNSGSPFRQWRKGIALARGKWVWIAESDDRCAPDMLGQLIQLDATHGSNLGLVYCQSRVIDAEGQVKESNASWTSNFRPDPFASNFIMDGKRFLAEYLKVKNVIPNASAVIFRRSLVDEATDWEGTADMRMLGDWLLWSRIVAKTRVGFIATPLNDFRSHQGISRHHHDMERKKRRLLEEAYLRNEWAHTGGVEQGSEEAALYRKWSGLVRFRYLLNATTDQCRVYPRSRPAFIAQLLRHKLQAL